VKHTTGYDGVEDLEVKEISPHLRKWVLRTHAVGPGFHRLEVLMDDQPIGMLRLPDNAHVQWLREKLQESET
jgi:hypothetical protein